MSDTLLYKFGQEGIPFHSTRMIKEQKKIRLRDQIYH